MPRCAPLLWVLAATAPGAIAVTDPAPGSTAAPPASAGLSPNLPVILEGEERVFATRGDEHCTVDELRQERLGALGGPLRTWRVVARGFCTSPASTLNSDARILVTRFDFAGNAVFEDAPARSAPDLTRPQARRGPG